jgi:nucleoid DNA-binding protein
MAKNDLVENGRASGIFQKREAEELGVFVQDMMTKALASVCEINVSCSGRFFFKQNHGRAGRTPRTGQPHTSTALKIVTFNSSIFLT